MGCGSNKRLRNEFVVGIGVPFMMVGGLFILFLVCVSTVTKFHVIKETNQIIRSLRRVHF